MCDCGSHRCIVLSVFCLTLLSFSPMFYFAYQSGASSKTVSQISNEEWRRQEKKITNMRMEFREVHELKKQQEAQFADLDRQCYPSHYLVRI